MIRTVNTLTAICLSMVIISIIINFNSNLPLSFTFLLTGTFILIFTLIINGYLDEIKIDKENAVLKNLNMSNWKFLLLGALSLITIIAILFSPLWIFHDSFTGSVNIGQLSGSVFTGIAAIVAASIAFYSTQQAENNKRDREIINDLNNRYAQIIDQLSSKSVKNRSFHFFALASLYQDWDVLSNNSTIINKQREHQQQFILKSIFRDELTEDEGKLTSTVANHIFPSVTSNIGAPLNLQNVFLNNIEIYGKNFENPMIDGASLANLEFNNCNFSSIDFNKCARIWDVRFNNCTFDQVSFSGNFELLTFSDCKYKKTTITANNRSINTRFIDTNFKELDISLSAPEKQEITKTVQKVNEVSNGIIISGNKSLSLSGVNTSASDKNDFKKYFEFINCKNQPEVRTSDE